MRAYSFSEVALCDHPRSVAGPATVANRYRADSRASYSSMEGDYISIVESQDSSRTLVQAPIRGDD